MKRILALIVGAFLIIAITGCSKEAVVKETYDNGFKTYYEMSDGSWKCDDHFYKHRLVISGRLHGAARDSTFVYLSNLEDIPFEQAWKAAGLSSDTNDYFLPEEAVLVELE